jgi:hypothetical protein
MSPDGVIASDATKNDFHDKHPNGISIISVAVAVENHDQFNTEYYNIIEDKIAQYGIKVPHPIIKDKFINRYVPLWSQEEARKDIVLELLSIDPLDTIYVTETYLKPTWIEMYREQDGTYRREPSYDFVENILFQYYDIISIWKYLEKYIGGENTHYNVMTDDFSGQICKAYEDVGQWCDSFDVIPFGDRTYPVLSLADLVTGLLKQEVYPLRRQEIKEYIQDETPAYVRAESVHDDDDLDKIVPHKTENVRTDILYPDPTVYIHRGRISKDRMMALDVFSHACTYAQHVGGCVKSFDESNDRYHLSGDDVIICLDNSSDEYLDYKELNSKYSAKVFNRGSGMEYLCDNIPSDLIL